MLKVFTPADGDAVSVGRDPGCDIVIDNLAIEARHLQLNFADHQARLDLANPDILIQINGVKPADNKDIALSRGDIIQMGKYQLSYLWENELNKPADTAPANQAETTAATPLSTLAKRSTQRGWLQYMSGPKLGRTLALNKPRVRIGTQDQSGALITAREDGYYISLINADVPVSIDNQPLGEQAIALQEGNTIQVGDARMLFFTEEA
jgi:hypothetical protein